MDNLALAKHKTINIECNINDINDLPETTLGDRIRKLRLLMYLTIKDLSIKSCLSEETISNIEKSRTTPNISSLNKLCQALNTNNTYLLGTDDWAEETQSEIIYKYRMISGLSQRQLAKKCNLHFSTIKDYENGKIKHPDTLKIIYKGIGYI
ncbi:helix-turn-helix transcriptional regulator [Tissierella sp.]|uniref:helix-turn-helix domain-containing protein n=1 Tax=Tissierella sp. TaxID=41274 RepID=UPI00285F919A|nr:helix-turn-helix transcriptional regulator [Tissierella sp.]MDR7856282.1 helix-turn-helix transcriptional regulator [Tissierella sp.]